MSEEFHARCAWCQIDVVSFAEPPRLVTVTTDAWDRQQWAVCLDCFAELLALVGKRRERQQPAALPDDDNNQGDGNLYRPDWNVPHA